MAEGHWLAALGLSLGVQWLAWPLACFFRTEKFYDLTGAAPAPTPALRHL